MQTMITKARVAGYLCSMLLAEIACHTLPLRCLRLARLSRLYVVWSDLVLSGLVLWYHHTQWPVVSVCRDAAADWGLQCMRYEIRDISPPAGVRAAMELQVGPFLWFCSPRCKASAVSKSKLLCSVA